MKQAFITVAIAVLTLWSGYVLGHQRGLLDERKVWESTREAVIAEQPPDRISERDMSRLRFVYRNPHHGLIAVRAPGLPAVNRPDPRVVDQYERSSP